VDKKWEKDFFASFWSSEMKDTHDTEEQSKAANNRVPSFLND
jgi:hypothetical protein